MTTENRLDDLEIKLAALEDLVDTLNQTIYRQHAKIDELETLCAALARRLTETQARLPETDAADEKPPHY
jgi:SlyX protein